MMTTLIIEKRNHLGEFVLSYPGEVLERGENWVCLRAVFDHQESNLGFVVFQQGDVFYEWFYSNQWYNIFQVHVGGTATVKGWYCNITRPAHIDSEHVYSDDLELDVFVMPNGTIILLDEEEFAALNLSTEERMAALRAIQDIRLKVSMRDIPFTAIE
jgi:predicted RNA-binding protein associated with RNAse of E/G family